MSRINTWLVDTIFNNLIQKQAVLRNSYKKQGVLRSLFLTTKLRPYKCTNLRFVHLIGIEHLSVHFFQ